MKKHMIIDSHQDISFNTLHVTGKDFFIENQFDASVLFSEKQLNQVDYVRLAQSGVKIVYGVTFPYRFDGKDIHSDPEFAQQETLRQLDFYHGLAEKSNGKIKIITSKSDLDFVFETDGVLGIVLLLEDALGITADLSNLEQLYQKGLRIIGPVWNRDNHFGGGTLSANGLLPEGENLLKKMESLGIALDTAHMNENMFYDSLRVFNGIVINSHTCAHMLNPHVRNLKDDQFALLAEKKAVIGVAFVPEFLNPVGTDASVRDIVAHMEHIISLCGIDRVAIGSDFDGMSWPKFVPDAGHAGEYHNLIALLQGKYSDDEIIQLTHRNWKRALYQIFKD
jgi:membrane dipeptidase